MIILNDGGGIMTNTKKKYIAILAAAVFAAAVYSEHFGAQHLIQAGHWVYDALQTLSLDAGEVSMADNAPLTVSELRLCLRKLPYEKLSPSSKMLYDRTKDFLMTEAHGADLGLMKVGANIEVSPTLMAKTNDDIAWSYGAEKTAGARAGTLDKYDRRDLANMKGINSENGLVSRDTSYRYGDAGNYMGNELVRPFAQIKFYVFVDDYLTIEADPCLANSFWGAVDNDNVINFPKNYDMVEFYWPFNVYGSAGTWKDKDGDDLKGCGVNFNIARQGIQIGRTAMGSVIYNSTFQSDMCAQFSVYSAKFKYNLDMAQLAKERYVYLHHFESAPFKWLRFSLMEGTLIDAPFELKFLNPFMIMHSFGIWQFGEYSKTPLDEEIYGESHVSAYLAFNFDIVPCRYLRIYGLYAQNELQLPWELSSDNGNSMPNSFAGQLGAEVTAPDKYDGFWHWAVEGIYTSPWCYLKQDKTGSLVSYRHDMQSDNDTDIYSWIGSPYGPDTMGFCLRALYEKPGKWSCGADYLFTARGTNSFGLFGNYIDIDGERYYMYYPSVRYKMYDRFGNSDFGLNAHDAKKAAQTYSLSGTVEYKNAITIKGSYRINEHLEAGARATFTFIFNNNHDGGQAECGAECAASIKWNLL